MEYDNSSEEDGINYHVSVMQKNMSRRNNKIWTDYVSEFKSVFLWADYAF